MEDTKQNFISKKEEVLSRFSDDFRKIYLDGDLLAHTVVHYLANDISSEQLLEHLITRDNQRQKIMESFIESMPGPPIMITKEQWEAVKVHFPNKQK